MNAQIVIIFVLHERVQTKDSRCRGRAGQDSQRAIEEIERKVVRACSGQDVNLDVLAAESMKGEPVVAVSIVTAGPHVGPETDYRQFAE